MFNVMWSNGFKSGTLDISFDNEYDASLHGEKWRYEMFEIDEILGLTPGKYEFIVVQG